MLRLHTGVVLACNCVHGAPSHVYWFTVSWTRIWTTRYVPYRDFGTGMSCVFHVYAVIYVCSYEYDERLGRVCDSRRVCWLKCGSDVD